MYITSAGKHTQKLLLVLLQPELIAICRTAAPTSSNNSKPLEGTFVETWFCRPRIYLAAAAAVEDLHHCLSKLLLLADGSTATGALCSHKDTSHLAANTILRVPVLPVDAWHIVCCSAA